MTHPPPAVELHLRPPRGSAVAGAPAVAAAAQAPQRGQQYGHGIAAAQLLQAQAHWEAMRYDDGLKVVKQAQRAARFEGAQALQAEAYHTAALLHMAKGGYLRAFSAWLQALELSLITRQHELGIDALIGVGKLWHIDGQGERAHDYHLLAYQRACQLQLHQHAGKAAICLARQRIALGNHALALDTLAEASALLQTDGNKTWLAEVHNYRSIALLAQDAPQQALAECAAAWHIVDNDDTLAWAQALTLLQRARALLATADLAGAATALGAARVLASQFGLDDFLAQIAQCWTGLAEAQGDWPRALAEYKLYLAHERHTLTRQHQSEQQALSSARFARLTRDMDKLVSRMLAGLAHAPPAEDASPLLPGAAWQRQLAQALQQSRAVGVLLVQWPPPANARHEQRRLLLLASFCDEHECVAALSGGQYALLLYPQRPGALVQLTASLHAIGKQLPWEPAAMVIGHAHSDQTCDADQLLAAARHALASSQAEPA